MRIPARVESEDDMRRMDVARAAAQKLAYAFPVRWHIEFEKSWI